MFQGMVKASAQARPRRSQTGGARRERTAVRTAPKRPSLRAVDDDAQGS
jgi:hypothetical protein